jgi:large subunit ribosomal protein L4e
LNKRRFAIASSVSATAVTGLVQGRGHRINKIAELPLVVDVDVTVEKTKKGFELLKKLGVDEDVVSSNKSKNIRAGIGKYRNRRFKQKKGPLIVHNNELDKLKCLRNFSGLEYSNVNSLSILKLAPGGHIGRFVIWTKSAFEQLEKIFGTSTKASERKRWGRAWSLPKVCMTNTDIEKILSSDEVYNVLNKLPKVNLCPLKRGNPLKNVKVMKSLNPSLAEDTTARNKKREAWSKDLNAKTKTFEELKAKRQLKLWEEITSKE